MRTRLLAVLAGTSISAIAAATPAWAQQAPPPAAPAPSTAQDQDTPEDQEEIIITGTQIRGATPAGSTLLTTTAKQAEEQGATNGNEILAQLPQASNFFQSLPSLAGLQGSTTAGLAAVSRIPNQAVTLRSLPNVNVGGSPTLILIDGHRVVPSGTNVLGGQNVDSSSISASTLLRTEIMPDGASAIYGSDAVTGVINYITRDDFDGVQVQARAGVARKYWQWDGSLTAGTKWNTGSVYAGFGYSWHDALLGKDRDYLAAVDANPNSPLFGTPLGLNCDAPNVAITSVVSGFNSRRLYPLTGINGTIQPFTTNNGTNGSGSAASANSIAGGNRCNQGQNPQGTDYTSFYPKEKRYNVSFGLRQEITDELTFSLKGWWMKRESQTYTGTNIQPMIVFGNVNYRPVCGGSSGNVCGTSGFFAGDNTRTQQIFTNLSSILGPSVSSFVTLQTWQVTPSLTWDLPKDWQLRALASYGESKTTGIQGSVDSVTLQSRVTSGLINPYNLPASAAGAFDRILQYSAQVGKFDLFNAKVVADGPLFRLPGGELRVAVGGEYIKTKLAQEATGTVQSPTPSNFIFVNPVDGSSNPLRYTQTVKAVFAEAQIPIVSEDMNVPLIHSLNVSASVRYDKYNDFGDTFNKMAGVTWEPVRWIKLRGNYNTSFAAPTNLQQLGTVTGAQLNNSNCNGPASSTGCTTQGQPVLPYFFGFYPPGDINGGLPLPPGGVASVLGAKNKTNPTGIGIAFTNGTVPGVGPQTSETWSFGFDIDPPFLPGLSFGASYYNLKLSDAIASPFNPAVQSEFDQHPELILCHGGVRGDAANAPAACAVPMALAELQPYLTPVTAGGLTLPSSLTTAGPAGTASGSNLGWSTVLANYCDPSVYTSGAGGGANCPANSYTVFYVADNRITNLGSVFAKGIDFHASYRTNVPWGSVDAFVSGTLNLETKSQARKGASKVDLQEFNFSKYRMSANLGTTSGGFRAQITWQHSAGLTIQPSQVGTEGTSTVPGTLNYGQTHVKGYDTFDLFFRYDFDELGDKNGLFKDLSITLNINNVFDNDPPRQGGSFGNGITLGRMFQLGITKRFD